MCRFSLFIKIFQWSKSKIEFLYMLYMTQYKKLVPAVLKLHTFHFVCQSSASEILSHLTSLSPGARRLRDRAAPELSPHTERIRIRQPLQVRRLHGHATRQMVQSGSLRKEGFCCDRGESSEETLCLSTCGHQAFCP